MISFLILLHSRVVALDYPVDLLSRDLHHLGDMARLHSLDLVKPNNLFLLHDLLGFSLIFRHSLAEEQRGSMHTFSFSLLLIVGHARPGYLPRESHSYPLFGLMVQ